MFLGNVGRYIPDNNVGRYIPDNSTLIIHSFDGLKSQAQ